MNEVRLIDANALREALDNDFQLSVYLDNKIDEAPTIDAIPVVHAKWEKSEDFLLKMLDLHAIKCSSCGEEGYFDEEGDVVAMHYNYCPICGARMDLESDSSACK